MNSKSDAKVSKDFVSKVNKPEKQKLIFQPCSGNEMFCNSGKREPEEEGRV